MCVRVYVYDCEIERCRNRWYYKHILDRSLLPLYCQIQILINLYPQGRFGFKSKAVKEKAKEVEKDSEDESDDEPVPAVRIVIVRHRSLFPLYALLYVCLSLCAAFSFSLFACVYVCLSLLLCLAVSLKASLSPRPSHCVSACLTSVSVSLFLCFGRAFCLVRSLFIHFNMNSISYYTSIVSCIYHHTITAHLYVRVSHTLFHFIHHFFSPSFSFFCFIRSRGNQHRNITGKKNSIKKVCGVLRAYLLLLSPIELIEFLTLLSSTVYVSILGRIILECSTHLLHSTPL